MPRPKKCRLIGQKPQTLYYKPRGIPARDLEEIEIGMDELEAIRLKDLEGLDQEESARRMGVSRPTFHRILSTARKKIATAILEGKALKIDERVRLVDARKYRCRKCSTTFRVPHGNRRKRARCPECDSDEIESLHRIEWR